MRIRLQELREDKDMTQAAVAAYLGMTRSVYGKYERQERGIPLPVLEMLAALYDTSVDYLMGITDTQEPYPRSKHFSPDLHEQKK